MRYKHFHVGLAIATLVTIIGLFGYRALNSFAVRSNTYAESKLYVTAFHRIRSETGLLPDPPKDAESCLKMLRMAGRFPVPLQYTQRVVPILRADGNWVLDTGSTEQGLAPLFVLIPEGVEAGSVVCLESRGPVIRNANVTSDFSFQNRAIALLDGGLTTAPELPPEKTSAYLLEYTRIDPYYRP